MPDWTSFQLPFPLCDFVIIASWKWNEMKFPDNSESMCYGFSIAQFLFTVYFMIGRYVIQSANTEQKDLFFYFKKVTVFF